MPSEMVKAKVEYSFFAPAKLKFLSLVLGRKVDFGCHLPSGPTRNGSD